jgi:hypothetical protein
MQKDTPGSSTEDAGSSEADVIALNDRQYRLWAEMLENKTGVRIAAHRGDFVKRQIVCRVNELGFSDVEDYFREVSELKRAFRLRPGDHRIEIRHDGYHSMYYELSVGAGTRHTLQVDLAKRLP